MVILSFPGRFRQDHQRYVDFVQFKYPDLGIETNLNRSSDP